MGKQSGETGHPFRCTADGLLDDVGRTDHDGATAGTSETGVKQFTGEKR